MKGLAIALLLVACGGSPAKTAEKPDPRLYAKKIALSWGIEQHGATQMDVFMQITDDKGQQTSYPLGTYDGICKVFTPAPEMKAATGVQCTADAKSTELHAVVKEDAIVVLKLDLAPGATPDPMSRVEVTRVQAPPGAAVQVGA